MREQKKEPQLLKERGTHGTLDSTTPRRGMLGQSWLDSRVVPATMPHPELLCLSMGNEWEAVPIQPATEQEVYNGNRLFC